MADRSSTRKKKEREFATVAWRVVQEAVGEPEEEKPGAREPTPEERRAAAVALGRLGGKKAGKVRASRLSEEQRQEIARKVAAARWGKTSS